MPVRKKHETKASALMEAKVEKKENSVGPKQEEIKTEPIIVTETVEKVEVIETIPQDKKAEPSLQTSSSDDPLKDFKERMVAEEMYPSDVPQNKNYMWPILLIFVLAVGLLVGIFAYKQGLFKVGEKTNVVSVKTTPTITPEPTKAVDLTAYSIEIQNGSGVSGEASRQQASLEGAGFTIDSIGNADSSDYIDTIIKVKANVDKAFIEKLKEALNSSFTVGEIETLAEDYSVPVVVILGTEK